MKTFFTTWFHTSLVYGFIYIQFFLVGIFLLVLWDYHRKRMKKKQYVKGVASLLLLLLIFTGLVILTYGVELPGMHRIMKVE